MLDRNDERTINANVDEVLEALRRNLAEHKEIVIEARIGYVQKCKEAIAGALKELAERAAKLEAGETVTMSPIHFQNIPPTDHSNEFVTILKMLELHKNAHDGIEHTLDVSVPATITLKAIDVQRYVLNEWQWMDDFLLSNSRYSAKSQVLAVEKGLR